MPPPKKIKINDSEINEPNYPESIKLLSIENELCTQLESINLDCKYIYNPLKYARVLHQTFIKKYFENSQKKILFLGMNPGPWGMCQNGIPFGEVNVVKDWFNISGTVEKPEREHSKKPIIGLDCHRSEQSGKKFWELFKILCEQPENFFKHSFVYNFCPFCFFNETGVNITPPEIKDKNIKTQLNHICEKAFIKIIQEFQFEIVIGVGDFAEKQALKSLNGVNDVKVIKIPHPSGRNVKYAKYWKEETFAVLENHDLVKYFVKDPTKNFDFLRKNDSNQRGIP